MVDKRIIEVDNMRDILSSFKSKLNDIINGYKDKVSDIEKEENFNRELSDYINYCESDILLLPFYDEDILGRVFERVFPFSTSELSKVKTAKYLIEASKNVDKGHFPQYNEAVSNIEGIFNSVCSFYQNRLNDSSLSTDKERYCSIIDSYSSIYDLVGEDGFNGLIEDVDLFKDTIDECGFSLDEVSSILNIAIVSNLKYLDGNGIVNSDSFNDNSLLESNINDLSSLLGE